MGGRLPPRAVGIVLALLLGALAGGAPAQPAGGEPASANEITISAVKFDRRVLEHELVPQFVKTHGAPSPQIEQIARWHEAVCPDVEGLPAAYAATVNSHIIEAAQLAGAPNAGAGHPCANNITVVFTSAPQQLLDSIAKEHAALLGSARVRGDTVFSRAVQAWYLTGTRQLSGSSNMPVRGLDAPRLQGTQAPSGQAVLGGRGDTGSPDASGQPKPGGAPAESSAPLIPDPAWDNSGAAGGVAGSRLGKGLRSELVHVTIIVDVHKLKGMALEAVSDYIAFLALTRVASLDACEPLPSIVDLYSASCSGRARPAALSDADTAFLKALYAADLDGKLGIEQAEVYSLMLAGLQEKRPAR